VSHIPAPLLLTIPETARILSVSPSTVHRMIRDDELRATHIRGCSRILGSSVMDHIEEANPTLLAPKQAEWAVPDCYRQKLE